MEQENIWDLVICVAQLKKKSIPPTAAANKDTCMYGPNMEFIRHLYGPNSHRLPQNSAAVKNSACRFGRHLIFF